ncbi:shikimate dehydrogenase [Microbacterium marinilacus]|uniref:Shikimate dehydrogenase (NADP(+)) n=1 Tax=Microbacterium marinilacus TaxID=415209 RepID=A0ABP7BTC2_9MICO|nr:shikimate dehydrogenase [Microbacterium marinilacus]MBY0689200.1 shikimate dehydrogenase [Microbacterium marinilacus]
MPDIASGSRGRATLIGLIGRGIAPSLSPAMHEREGARHGMPYVYRTIEIGQREATADRLGELLASTRRLGFDGLNITHPVKQLVVPLLDELAPSAALVGAVNTIVFEGRRTIGHNTDVTGFGAAFDETFGTGAHGRVVLVGAGGAGAAVATALAGRPIAELVIVDADPGRAEQLANEIATDVWDSVRAIEPAALPDALAEAAGVVNATPYGMADHPGTAFDPALLTDRMWVADIVYRPAETALLVAARERGCRVMSGLRMAMGQAADAFEIFTGEPADRRAMLADLEELVAAEAAATPSPASPGDRHGDDAAADTTDERKKR